MSEAPTTTATLRCPTAADTRELGHALAALVRAGDLLVLTGGLGAGKTTFTQGLAAGLGVAEAVTSPTFVLARVHRSTTGRPTLVHVDAYRLSGADELDDLDLDTDLEECVTVVEWGAGLAEVLAGDRLEITLTPEPLPSLREPDEPDGADDPDGAADEVRTITLLGVGERWHGLALPGRDQRRSLALGGEHQDLRAVLGPARADDLGRGRLP